MVLRLNEKFKIPILFAFIILCHKFSLTCEVNCSHTKLLFKSNHQLRRSTFFQPTHPDRIYQSLLRIRNPQLVSRWLFAGSSITALGYYSSFIADLKERGLSINTTNRGNGGSDVLYSAYCVDYGSDYDVIFVDFAITAKAQTRMEVTEHTLRQFWNSGRNGAPPLIVLINFISMKTICADPVPYLELAQYYGLIVIDLCSVTVHCYSGSRWKEYAADTIHPTSSSQGTEFVRGVLNFWWDYIFEIVSSSAHLREGASLFKLPSVLYSRGAVTGSPKCMTASDSARESLQPVGPAIGFQLVTREKIGIEVFKNIKRCWQGSAPGHRITFEFSGKTIDVAIYQHPYGMGIASVYIDGYAKLGRVLSGYFSGFNETGTVMGRQHIFPVNRNLTTGKHNITFEITTDYGAIWAPGHQFQIIALLYTGE
jgi:hypothetical protein